MGLFSKGESDRLGKIVAQATPLLEPGEEVKGVAITTHSSAFKQQAYGVVTTDRRIVMVPTSMRLEPKGEPVSIRPEDVTRTQIAGTNESFMAMMKKMGDDNLRFDAHGKTYKLSALTGAGLDRLFSGDDQRTGIQALCEFLVATGR